MSYSDDWAIVDALVPIVLSNIQGCIVEIGLGNSTLMLAKHAKNFNRKHYGCDVRKSVCSFARDTVDYQGLILYNCKSVSFIKEFDDIPAIVFLDGNHRYATVKTETEFFLNKLAYGGMIFLHDTYLCKRWHDRYEAKGKESDTYKIRQDLEKNELVYVMTFPYTAAYCGLTIVLKKDANREYYQT